MRESSPPDAILDIGFAGSPCLQRPKLHAVTAHGIERHPLNSTTNSIPAYLKSKFLLHPPAKFFRTIFALAGKFLCQRNRTLFFPVQMQPPAPPALHRKTQWHAAALCSLPKTQDLLLCVSVFKSKHRDKSSRSSIFSNRSGSKSTEISLRDSIGILQHITGLLQLLRRIPQFRKIRGMLFRGSAEAASAPAAVPGCFVAGKQSFTISIEADIFSLHCSVWRPAPV